MRALVAHGDWLLSAADDGTIRAWALGTWAALGTMRACGEDTLQRPRCLGVSGSKLISG